ncbi:MAG: PrsW family intramembrane metalloprotease [Planctomycetes bacterium]|nr:PrsW family intramembrane metalloprotease [Planctomycetota bacterium]
MSQLLAVLLAVAPCLFWLDAVLRHDDHEREPWSLVALAVLLGAAAPWLVLWLRPWLEAWAGSAAGARGAALDAFVVTALLEELCKLVALLPLLRHRECDEPIDGVVYGSAVGLGFAACENVLFCGPTGDVALALQRVFTATLLHTVCTGLLGGAFAVAKLDARGVRRGLWVVGGFCVAVALHGGYDLLLAGEQPNVMLALLGVLPVGLGLLFVKLRWARSRSPHFHPPD